MPTKDLLTRKALTVTALLAAALLLGVMNRAGPHRWAVAATSWTLQGRVYEGEVGTEPPTSRPLPGVTVAAYGASNPYPDEGIFIISTTTDSDGWYGLTVPAGYEYYHIRETDPAGYSSLGATTVNGTVRTANWIEYVIPLDGQTLTGNKFWDYPDLIMESLVAEPNPAYAEEEVVLTAEVRNTGIYSFENVPVRYAADGVPFDTRFVAEIPPDTSVPVTTTRTFSTTSLIALSATVNPTGTLPELQDNNTATTTLEVMWEENPGWARPDLALSDLNFTPHRPNPDDTLIVTAQLSNFGLGDVPSATVVLLIDDTIVDEQLFENIGPGDTGPVTLTWPSTVLGRHTLELMADPDLLVEERTEANNRLDEWVRVAGDPDPLPDLEVESIELDPPTPGVGDNAIIAVEVHNEGYAEATDLPVLLTLDGYELSRTVIPVLSPDESTVVTAEWADVSEGEHVISAWIDPDDDILDDSVRAHVAQAFVIPGTQYLLSGSGGSNRWKFIGPDTIDNSAYVGRIDSIAISQQDSQRIVVGAPSGGVWVTNDGGQNWGPLADHLPSSGFPIVAFDPTNDYIIYAATGSPLWGGGTGLYKSTDGGAHWSTFAGTWLGSGYGGLILRYTTPNTLTILAGTNSGVWMWEGDKDTTSTALSQWKHVWQQQQTTPGLGSQVTDMLITPETSPKLYVAVYKDAVYRVAASDPVSGTWTRLSTGLTAGFTAIKLGNSAADADRVYVATLRAGQCDPADKDRTGILEVYRRDAADTSWNFVSRPTENSNICDNAYNAFIAVHPTNANAIYIGGVKGWRSLDGGQHFTYTIPYVHDDYKALAFNPSDPSVVYLTSDGGVYRCINDTADMSCVGLNDGLGVTQFYDIALAATKTVRTIGGTQDNANIMSDGSTAWTSLGYGGDGRYVLIDPTAPDTMFAQQQYLDSIFSTTVAGPKWYPAHNGLPTSNGGVERWDPFMVMDPDDSSTLLATGGQIYRTTNSGGQWSPIGPLLSIDPINEDFAQVTIDSVNDRYYAGTTRGRIWTVLASQAGSLSWTCIYTHPYHQLVRGLLIDPADTNILYLTFAGQGAWRVVKLTHSGGWPGTWTATDLTGSLPTNRTLSGGYGPWGGVVRGLLKYPNADVLYVGTNHGVYQGQLVNNAWQWFPDTCGLPPTYVSDLELHSTGNFVRAATFGRSAYERSLTLLNPTADAYDTPTRNDTLATAASISGTWVTGTLMPGLTVNNLTLDRLNDVDYFTVQLPPAGSNDCLPAGDPCLNYPQCQQCSFGLTVHAPNTPDPFELRLYNANGSVFKEFTSVSNLSYGLERPRDFFPSGTITISVRSPTGCRSQYDLYFSYNRWYYEKEAPDILFDPPIIKRLVPELGNLFWMFPADPEVINQAFVGQSPDQLPEQRLIFHWDQEHDFLATFNIEGGGNLDATLYDAGGNPVASAGPAVVSVAAGQESSREPGLSGVSITNTKQISVTDLPAGWYALNVGNGDFPTYFEVTFNVLRVYLPLILRDYP